MNSTSDDEIDLIEDALLHMERRLEGRAAAEPFCRQELAALKKACQVVPWGEDLYTGFLGFQNNRKGMPDINQVEAWMRSYDTFLRETETQFV